MGVDDRAAQAALDALIVNMTRANKQIVHEMAYAVKGAYEIDAPRDTGRMADTASITGPYPAGTYGYEAKFGPVVEYGRQRELGGPIEPHGHPFLAFFWPDGPDHLPHLPDGRVLVRHVFQFPRPALKRAVTAARPLFIRFAIRHWADAIRKV